MTPELIDTPAALAGLMDRVVAAPLVALDTEAASFHRYHDRIYLIQLSTPDLTAVIDPLAVGSLESIGSLLANPAIQKLFHDADYDLRLFDHEFGFHARNLFDTRIAAQFLNEPGIGLAALLVKYFGVTPDKRFQRADWAARPLSPAMMEYAAGDTSNLCELSAILRTQLVAAGRIAWVEEECRRAEEIRWTAAVADPETDFLRMKGARGLERRALALLQQLYNWRADVSSELDRAEFRVINNEALIELATHPVHSLDELGRVRGVGRDLVEKRGGEILAAIVRGAGVPDDRLPRFPRSVRRAPDPAYEARVEILKRERNRLAEELQLAPGVLCPNGTLEAIASADPANLDELATLEPVRQWQVEVIGTPLLNALHAAPAAATETT